MESKTITILKTQSLILEYTLLSLAFLIPFFISGPQLLTGTIVNTLLFLFASQTNSRRMLPILILPSIGAALNGILLGKFTVFLLYFLPFIWVSNYILIHSFRMILKKTHFIIAVALSSFLKYIFLFSIALIFTSSKIVPLLFLQLMGLFQLYTALLGGGIALLLVMFIKKKNE